MILKAMVLLPALIMCLFIFLKARCHSAASITRHCLLASNLTALLLLRQLLLSPQMELKHTS